MTGRHLTPSRLKTLLLKLTNSFQKEKRARTSTIGSSIECCRAAGRAHKWVPLNALEELLSTPLSHSPLLRSDAPCKIALCRSVLHFPSFPPMPCIVTIGTLALGPLPSISLESGRSDTLEDRRKRTFPSSFFLLLLVIGTTYTFTES